MKCPWGFSRNVLSNNFCLLCHSDVVKIFLICAKPFVNGRVDFLNFTINWEKINNWKAVHYRSFFLLVLTIAFEDYWDKFIRNITRKTIKCILDIASTEWHINTILHFNLQYFLRISSEIAENSFVSLTTYHLSVTIYLFALLKQLFGSEGYRNEI